jgi:hypothetical protein
MPVVPIGPIGRIGPIHGLTQDVSTPTDYGRAGARPYQSPITVRGSAEHNLNGSLNGGGLGLDAGA